MLDIIYTPVSSADWMLTAGKLGIPGMVGTAMYNDMQVCKLVSLLFTNTTKGCPPNGTQGVEASVRFKSFNVRIAPVDDLHLSVSVAFS